MELESHIRTTRSLYSPASRTCLKNRCCLQQVDEFAHSDVRLSKNCRKRPPGKFPVNRALAPFVFAQVGTDLSRTTRLVQSFKLPTRTRGVPNILINSALRFVCVIVPKPRDGTGHARLQRLDVGFDFLAFASMRLAGRSVPSHTSRATLERPRLLFREYARIC